MMAMSANIPLLLWLLVIVLVTTTSAAAARTKKIRVASNGHRRLRELSDLHDSSWREHLIPPTIATSHTTTTHSGWGVEDNKRPKVAPAIQTVIEGAAASSGGTASSASSKGSSSSGKGKHSKSKKSKGKGKGGGHAVIEYDDDYTASEGSSDGSYDDDDDDEGHAYATHPPKGPKKKSSKAGVDKPPVDCVHMDGIYFGDGCDESKLHSRQLGSCVSELKTGAAYTNNHFLSQLPSPQEMTRKVNFTDPSLHLRILQTFLQTMLYLLLFIFHQLLFLLRTPSRRQQAALPRLQSIFQR